MKNLLLIVIILIGLSACRKDNQYFKLNTVTINSINKKGLPQQRFFVKIVDVADAMRIIGTSALYPSELPLPATLAVQSSLKQTLYKNSCEVQLWGEVSGLISTVKMNMKEYKIIFPSAMPVSNQEMTITLSGSWE